jgi:pimeloyl-ACP methyl ester carboxylesterase
MAYEVSGPEKGRPLLLVHGWPDDVRTWDRILPALHRQGYRTITPYLRGFGGTTFLNPSTCKSGEIIALAKDVLELTEALGIDRFTIIGHDWGARIAYTLGALAPDRLDRIVALSVPLNRDNPDELTEQQLQNYWYQWYFSSSLAERRLQEKRQDFIRHIWKLWATDLPGLEAELAVTEPSFLNEDWVQITLHSYRVRWKLAKPDEAYGVLQSVLNHDPVVKVPVLSIRGEHDPVHAPAMYRLTPGLCTGGFEFVTIRNSGHFPQRENAGQLLSAILPFLK